MPDVLLELAFGAKSKYPSFLEIETNLIDKPVVRDKYVFKMEKSMAPWEMEIGRHRDLTIIKGMAEHQAEKDPEERLKYIAWERSRNEPCQRPDRFLWKFDSERLGCFKLAFSKRGHFLAAACTMVDSRTIIKIYNVLEGKHLCSLKGHHDLIHDLQWSEDDTVIITASADGSCKVWDVSRKSSDIPNKFAHNDNDEYFFITNLFHPSFVYGCQFYQDEDYYG